MKFPIRNPWINRQTKRTIILFTWITPATKTAIVLNSNRNCLYYDYYYFLVKIRIKNGAASAPKAAPIGIPPIRPPKTPESPALLPKYVTIVVG